MLVLQLQEELALARGAAGAEDVSRRRQERQQADSELQLVTSERDVLMEHFKVSTPQKPQISNAFP